MHMPVERAHTGRHGGLVLGIGHMVGEPAVGVQELAACAAERKLLPPVSRMLRDTARVGELCMHSRPPLTPNLSSGVKWGSRQADVLAMESQDQAAQQGAAATQAS